MGKAAKATVIIGGAGITAILAWILTRKKAEAQPENIVLDNLDIYPPEVYVGQPVTISMRATNIGIVQATKEILCEVY